MDSLTRLLSSVLNVDSNCFKNLNVRSDMCFSEADAVNTFRTHFYKANLVDKVVRT